MSLKPVLTLLAGVALLASGCSMGSMDSGPTAMGSGQAAPQSGAPGSVPTTPTPSSVH